MCIYFRVFLCKSGLFLEKINEKMGGDGVTKERFGPEDFQVRKICAKKRFNIVFIKVRIINWIA